MIETTTKDIRDAQSGDKNSMAKLVEENQGLIWSIVKRFSGRGYEIEDIYQIAAMGFVKSIRNFDTNFEVKLSTYAVPYIMGEIKRFLRDDGPVKVSRSLKDLNRRIKDFQKEYIKNKGIDPTIGEVANALNTSVDEINLALEIDNPVTSIDEGVYYNNKDDKSLSIIETLSTNKDEPTMVTNKIMIKDFIQNLNDRDKEIILLRYYNDKTQAEVAKIIKISQVQVSRIERKILDKLKKELA